MNQRIAIMAVDSDYPNLALMKIAAHHKQQGDTVSWYNPFDQYDVLYMSKIFGFTPDYPYCITNADKTVKGGTGYDMAVTLPDNIEHLTPDYSMYPQIDSRTAYGFLTRGCPNKCKWCVVPQKEGAIRPYQKIEDIAVDGRNQIILMDNNVLASDFGIEQIEKIIKLRIKVDFNQALDARLVTPEIAKMLAKVKWIHRIRFGCDTTEQIDDCERAIELIDGAGYKGEYFFYCILLDNFNESFNRVNYWKNKGKRYIPHCQPYRDVNNPNQIIPQWQRDMARWSDRKELLRTCEFAEYEPRKGFICAEYFNIYDTQNEIHNQNQPARAQECDLA